MMTKKHFIAIADLIEIQSHKEYLRTAEDMRKQLSISLSRYFEELNPNFDKDRFLLACGVTE